MSLKAGRLNHQVSIQRFESLVDSNGDEIRDEFGSPVREWVEVHKAWAEVAPLSAREFIQSQATQSQVTARITIRYTPLVDPTCRIVWRGRFYNIHGVLSDTRSGLEYLTLPVSEGVNDGE